MTTCRQKAPAAPTAHREPIHLLLTDMVMPGLSGLQLAQTLLPRTPGLKLLFMSGYLEHSLAGDLGLGSASVHFIQKPFAVGELSRRVREALDNGRGPATTASAPGRDTTPVSLAPHPPSL